MEKENNQSATKRKIEQRPKNVVHTA